MKRQRRKKGREQVWSLFFFWVGMVLVLALVSLVVKGVWYGWYLWRWYDEPRVNIVSFDPARVVVFSFDKEKKTVWLYVVPGEVKWVDQMGKEAKRLMEWRVDWGDKGMGLERMADLIEFNLAIPVKGLIWREQEEQCSLESVKCFKSSYWPIGFKSRVGGSMSMWHRWFGRWLMHYYHIKVEKIKFSGQEFDQNQWDKLWQQSMKGEVVDVAILGVVKSRNLIKWYERMVTNLGWRVVQTEWVKKRWLDNLLGSIQEDRNYCLWQEKKTKRYSKSQLAMFLRCEVSDKIKVANARANLAIIITQFIW